jgi:hypothetical protein
MLGFGRHDDSRPERPRYEPEVIPPLHERADSGVFVFVDRHGNTRRVTFRPPGPVAVMIALALFGVAAAAGLIMLLGFVLVWIPAIIALIAVLALASYVRRFSWRWRRRP